MNCTESDPNMNGPWCTAVAEGLRDNASLKSLCIFTDKDFIDLQSFSDALVTKPIALQNLSIQGIDTSPTEGSGRAFGLALSNAICPLQSLDLGIELESEWVIGLLRSIELPKLDSLTISNSNFLEDDWQEFGCSILPNLPLRELIFCMYAMSESSQEAIVNGIKQNTSLESLPVLRPTLAQPHRQGEIQKYTTRLDSESCHCISKGPAAYCRSSNIQCGPLPRAFQYSSL